MIRLQMDAVYAKRSVILDENSKCCWQFTIERELAVDKWIKTL
jgi:hypothetical protein